MQKPQSVTILEKLGRVRLSPSFFMRDLLYSEISQIHGIPNVPDYPDLAIETGTQLCTTVLEPLQETFGRISIRSAYRSPAVNAKGARIKINTTAPAMKPVTRTTSGTTGTPKGGLAQPPTSWSTPLSPTTKKRAVGRHWPDGLMTKFPATPHSTSSPSLRPLIWAGMTSPRRRSRVIYQGRKEYRPGQGWRILQGIILGSMRSFWTVLQMTKPLAVDVFEGQLLILIKEALGITGVRVDHDKELLCWRLSLSWSFTEVFLPGRGAGSLP